MEKSFQISPYGCSFNMKGIDFINCTLTQYNSALESVTQQAMNLSQCYSVCCTAFYPDFRNQSIKLFECGKNAQLILGIGTIIALAILALSCLGYCCYLSCSEKSRLFKSAMKNTELDFLFMVGNLLGLEIGSYCMMVTRFYLDTNQNTNQRPDQNRIENEIKPIKNIYQVQSENSRQQVRHRETFILKEQEKQNQMIVRLHSVTKTALKNYIQGKSKKRRDDDSKIQLKGGNGLNKKQEAAKQTNIYFKDDDSDESSD